MTGALSLSVFRSLASSPGTMTSALFPVVLSFGCGGGDKEVIPGPPLTLTGDYAITISVTKDTCGFNVPGLDTVMHVQESGTSAATVDIPVAGQCNPAEFTRTDDTLQRSEAGRIQIDFGCPLGACTMNLQSITTLEFAAGGGMTGTETNLLRDERGDCSCVTLPCNFNLAIAGHLCSGCFDCTARAQLGSAAPREGLLRLLLDQASSSPPHSGPARPG